MREMGPTKIGLPYKSDLHEWAWGTVYVDRISLHTRPILLFPDPMEWLIVVPVIRELWRSYPPCDE